jgi:Type II secretion system (T2SS), protein G
MADQLDVRLSRGEGLPPNFGGWLRRDFSGSETDPWRRPWYLKPGRRSYTVGSMGPDGADGTGDDITETRNLPQSR